MGQITTLFPRKVIGIASELVDRNAMLRSLGIDPDEPVDPAQMVTASDYYDFLERVARADGDGTTIPLRAGAAMRCDDYGALGLSWKSAPTIQGSYDRAVRYARVLTNVSTYEIEPTEQGAYMHLHRDGERRLGMRLSNEATISSIYQISLEAAEKPFHPIGIYFKHKAPKSLKAHKAFFGCPVHYETDRDALLVSHESLSAPNRLGDKTISRFFCDHLEVEVNQLEQEDANADKSVSLEKQLDYLVRVEITQALSEGVPSIAQIADQLNMSARTLQRRLSDLGHSYQKLIDQARHDLSKHLLKQTSYSLTEVAFMTGFSEQSAFTRAFKRWTDLTPRAYRQSA